MRSRSRLLLAILAAVAGCGIYRPPLVPVAGPRARLEALAGHWDGAYYGNDSRRSGSIVFEMRANGDSAFGDVFMEQISQMNAIAVNGDVHRPPAPTAVPRGLFISFVAVADSAISGRLAPYTAPDCECTVTTTFAGKQRGDTIAGTFVTEGKLIVTQLGTWRVVRRR